MNDHGPDAYWKNRLRDAEAAAQPKLYSYKCGHCQHPILIPANQFRQGSVGLLVICPQCHRSTGCKNPD